MLPDDLMVFQTAWIELEFFTKVFFEIIGQLLAACASRSSRKFTFCWVVKQQASPSFVKPLNGSTFVFLPQVMPSVRNGAKLLSRDNVYNKFWRQFLKLFIVCDFDEHHCFSARVRWVRAMFVVSVAV